MKNTGGQYNTALGTFDSSKGDLRLVGVTAGIGGRSYMNYQKVPAKLAEFCQRINERRQMLLQGAFRPIQLGMYFRRVFRSCQSHKCALMVRAFRQPTFS